MNGFLLASNWNSQGHEITVSKAWAMPNANTFQIKPIKNFVESHLWEGAVIVDPFANSSKYGTITNDLNEEYDTTYHMDALEFLKSLPDESADIILYDPPYSATKAARCYKGFGKDKLDLSMVNGKYWKWCKDNCARILRMGGKILSFGWNTNGLGKGRGFAPVEILIVSHGGTRNDTLCTAEEKVAPWEAISKE